MEKQIRTMGIKLIPIGNSKGVRIPKVLIQKYGLNNSLLLEETEKGLLLRKKTVNFPGKTHIKPWLLKTKIGVNLTQHFLTVKDQSRPDAKTHN